jgi:hypothetical protein
MEYINAIATEITATVSFDVTFKYEQIINNVVLSNNSGGSTMSGQIRKDEGVVIASSPQSIYFKVSGINTPFTDNAYALAVTAWDSTGATVPTPKVTKYADHFVLDIGDSGICEYIGVHD